MSHGPKKGSLFVTLIYKHHRNGLEDAPTALQLQAFVLLSKWLVCGFCTLLIYFAPTFWPFISSLRNGAPHADTWGNV